MVGLSVGVPVKSPPPHKMECNEKEDQMTVQPYTSFYTILLHQHFYKSI